MNPYPRRGRGPNCLRVLPWKRSTTRGSNPMEPLEGPGPARPVSSYAPEVTSENFVGWRSRTRTWDNLINSQVLLPTELIAKENQFGAGTGTRTRDKSLEGSCVTATPYPL